MRIHVLTATAACLALAACGGAEKKADGNEAAGAESGSGSAASAEGISMQPGEWEVTVETLKMDAPGLPKQMTTAMGGGQKMTVRSCITPEQARAPKGDVFAGKKQGNCDYKDFSVSGGRVKGSMTCTGGDMPGSVTMEMDGRYGSTSYEINQKMTTRGVGADMTVESRVSAQRIGECPAGKG